MTTATLARYFCAGILYERQRRAQEAREAVATLTGREVHPVIGVMG